MSSQDELINQMMSITGLDSVNQTKSLLEVRKDQCINKPLISNLTLTLERKLEH